MSNYILPFLVLLILLYGIYKKVDVYESFLVGVKESFPLVLTIFPSLFAMILGVNVFLKSGILNDIFSLFPFSFPKEIIVLGLLRPISSSSSFAMLSSIFKMYGVDSFPSYLASIIQGSTDTTFYIIALYFGSVGIKKCRYSIKVGLLADLAGFLISIIIAKILF